MVTLSYSMQNCHEDSGWCFEQSTFQAFYMFGVDLVSVDGNSLDGTDVIGAFNGGVCLGFFEAAGNDGSVYTVPVMGNDGGFPDYLSAGDIPEIRIFDSSAGSELETSLDNTLPGWGNNELFVLNGTDPGGLPAVLVTACSSGIENLDECGVCDGPGIETWYDDTDGDGWGCDAMGDACASDADPGWVTNGDDADCDVACDSNVFDQCGVCDGTDECVGCTDPFASNYEDDNTIPDGSCLPHAVTGLTASEAGEGLGGVIGLSWDAASGASHYTVYESGSSIASGVIGTSYSHAGLDPSSEHSYTVSATHADGNEGDSSGSASATTAGLAAANLDSVAVGQGKLTVHWSAANAENAYNGHLYSFDVYRDGSLVASKSSSSRQWTDTDVVPGTSYCYTVNAINDEYGDAPASGEACGVPDEVAGWGINITAEINGWGLFVETDDFNYMGVDENATDEFDLGGVDVPEPPEPPGNFVSFYFPHPEWLALHDDYTQDIRLMRALDDELMTWDAQLISNMDGLTTVTFDFVSDAGGYPVYVELNGSFIPIEDGGGVEVMLSAFVEQDLSIIVGNITPQAPTGLEAAQDENDGRHILLNWNATDDCCGSLESRYPPTHFYIYRMIRNVDDEETIPDESLTFSPVWLDQVASSETSYLDSRLNELTDDDRYIYETSFSYMITGVNHGYGYEELASGETGLESGFSNEDGATTMNNANPVSDAGSDQEHTVEHDGSHLDGDNPDDIGLGLDGSGSNDPEYGDELIYSWTQTGGPSIELSDASAITPSFTAVNPNGGDTQVYEFNLLVTDNYWIGEPPALTNHVDNSSVSVTVHSEPNDDPDADIDIITEDPGCEEPFDDANGNGEYDAGEDYVDCNDDGEWNAGDPSWSCDNNYTCPVDDYTEAGEDGPRWQVPHDGTPDTDLATIAYIGSGSSDPDGDDLDYLWDTGTPAEPFDDANGNGQYDFGEPYFDVNGDGEWNDGDPYTAQNIVVERGAGDHEFELSVTDPYGASNSTSIVILVEPEPNTDPVAVAGIDQTWYLDAYTDEHLINMPMNIDDGTGLPGYGNNSFDPDEHYLTGANDVISYQWSNGSTDPVTSTYLAVGVHSFTLTVCDPYGACDEDDVTITILDEPAPATPQGLSLDPWLYHIDVEWDAVDVVDCDDRDFDEDCLSGVVDHYLLYRGGSLLTTLDDEVTSFVDNSLDTDSEYCYFVVAVNSHGTAGSQSATSCAFTGIPPTVEVNSPNGAEIYTTDQEFDVSWSTTDGKFHAWDDWGVLIETQSEKHFIGLIEVLYSDDDGESWSVVDDTDVPTQTETSVSVSGDLIINYGASIAVRLTDTGDAVGNPYTLSEYYDEADNSFTVSGSTLSKGFNFGWSLFGSPLVPDNSSMVENLSAPGNFGPLGEYWYVYDQDGSYPLGPDDSEYLINHGQGYILTLQTETASLTLDGDVVDIADPSSESSDLSLSEGWNLVSDPLVAIVDKDQIVVHTNDSDYSWEDAVDFGFIQGTVNGWSNSDAFYYSTSQIEPWEGYWIHASRDLDLKFSPHNHDDLGRDLSDAWVMNIFARGINDGSSGDLVSVGLSESATEGFRYGEDEYDLPNPLGFKFVDLYFNRVDWLMDGLIDVNGNEIQSSDFFRDVRSYTESDVPQVWQVSANTNNMDPSDEIEISWNQYDAISVGEDFDVYLHLNGQVFDMKQISSVIVNNITETDMFVQIGGDSPLTYDSVGVPAEFNVSAAYPNPFNPVTNVDFAVPEAGKVSIKVYNLVGQVMETLVDDYTSAGFHTVSWNASSVPSGLYFITVEAGENVSTQKLMLMK